MHGDPEKNSHIHDTASQRQVLERGPGPASISTTWELCRNADPQALTSRIRSSGMGAQATVFQQALLVNLGTWCPFKFENLDFIVVTWSAASEQD